MREIAAPALAIGRLHCRIRRVGDINEMDQTGDATLVVDLSQQDVFGPSGQEGGAHFATIGVGTEPITYFVGRNGSGKSRIARAIATKVGGTIRSTDRLFALTSVSNYGWGAIPSPEQHRGVPLGEQERQQIRSSASQGGAAEDLFALREQPEVALRVAAFVRRALGRNVELHERSGFLDPTIRIGTTSYSLLRDEGHGLRELIVLLAAVYRQEWSLLVVDEPELHLHPSLARLWLAELESECRQTNRRAIVVTHQPQLIRPTSASHLSSIFLFQPEAPPVRFTDHMLAGQFDRATATIQENPELISQLVFSPRPVLVEGPSDVAALSVALARTQPPEAVAQTDLVACGGSQGVALWFEIARKLGLEVKAVADLDAVFDPAMQRCMDADAGVRERYQLDLSTEPPTTRKVLTPINEEIGRLGTPSDPRSRADALRLVGGGHASRRDRLLAVWAQAGLWLHPQGRLEQVLGIETKGVGPAREAAATAGAIDAVAAWAAFVLDTSADVEALLGVEVERIAHAVAEALRLDPQLQLTAPVGATAEADARLVDISPLGHGEHKIVVRAPSQFVGYWLTFTRGSTSESLLLQPPPVEDTDSSA